MPYCSIPGNVRYDSNPVKQQPVWSSEIRISDKGLR
jgi:hypothetical protein